MLLNICQKIKKIAINLKLIYIVAKLKFIAVIQKQQQQNKEEKNVNKQIYNFRLSLKR